jgi:hypothetical protein
MTRRERTDASPQARALLEPEGPNDATTEERRCDPSNVPLLSTPSPTPAVRHTSPPSPSHISGAHP